MCKSKHEAWFQRPLDVPFNRVAKWGSSSQRQLTDLEVERDQKHTIFPSFLIGLLMRLEAKCKKFSWMMPNGKIPSE
jgi:hypothetical protein